MATAATVTADAAPPAKGGKKKLIIIIAAAVLVLVLGGGGAAYFMMKKAPAEGEEDGSEAAAQSEAHAPAAAHAKRDPKHPPTFVPLDPFTVNLADKEAERYAQIGVTLEIPDAKTGEELKTYMPAIRNNILMVLAHKRSSDLLERAGKEKLAEEVLRETERALGLEPAVPGAAKKGDHDDEPRPVRAVHFSNFIIQ
jgi:flagellar FliL protein